MTDISKTKVYEAIGVATPTLLAPLTERNSGLSLPAADADLVKVLTVPRIGQYYEGERYFKYARRNLTDLFLGRAPQIRRWIDLTGPSPALSLYDVLGDLEANYGLQLSTDDVEPASFSMVSDGSMGPDVTTSTVTVTAKAGSYGYTGSFVLRWVLGLPSLNQKLTQNDVDGRVFPATVSAGNFTREIQDLRTRNFDCTYMRTLLDDPLLTTVTVSDASVAGLWSQIFSNLTTYHGVTYSTGSQTVYGGLRGQSVVRILTSVPQAGYATNPVYERCLVINLGSDVTWGAGKIYLHYDSQLTA